jgi:hypothetical protein
MRRALLLSVALPLLLASCRDYDVYGPGGRRVEGYYTYAGTVSGKPGHTVVGELVISRQYGREAEVHLDWTYYDRDGPLFDIRTDVPAIAVIDGYGRIDFDFEGDLFLYGRRTWFRLSHDGRIDGRTIYGDWRLRTELSTTDRGAFTASR